VKTGYLFGLATVFVSTLGWANGARGALVTRSVLVTAKQGPWAYVAGTGGLNSNYVYGTSNGLQAPVTITTLNGFVFLPGGTFDITYVSGTIKAGTGGAFPGEDADGNPAKPVNADIDTSNGLFYASEYIPAVQFPVNQGALVGTFTDSAGAIVGNPFKIGNSAHLVVPIGASQLQMGVNDDFYGDNSGSWSTTVSQVPEPSSFAVVGVGGLSLLSRRRRQQVATKTDG
jgi:hypothetical protein